MWYSGLSMLSILNSFVAKQTHSHTNFAQMQRVDWMFVCVLLSLTKQCEKWDVRIVGDAILYQSGSKLRETAEKGKWQIQAKLQKK